LRDKEKTCARWQWEEVLRRTGKVEKEYWTNEKVGQNLQAHPKKSNQEAYILAGTEKSTRARVKRIEGKLGLNRRQVGKGGIGRRNR